MVITLENIGDFSLQEVFDQCVTHLLAQNQRCYGIYEGNCVFRRVEEDGTVTRCAVGCFISDSMYTEDFEERSFYIIAEELFNVTIAEDAYSLLRDLQNVHDFKLPPQWSESLQTVAHGYDLVFKGA